MRRVALVVSIVCSVVVGSPIVRAAQSSSQHSLPALLQLPHGLRAAGHAVASPVRDATVKAHPHQTASQLALPPSAYSPGVPNSQFTGTEDNATADSNFFRYFHSVTYEQLGRITGYYTRADWTPSGFTDQVFFRYQGSTFSNSGAAANALKDGVTNTQKVTGSSPTDCSSALGVPCSILTYEAQGGPVKLVIFQVNQCLAEVASIASDAIETADDSQISQTVSNISGAALTVMQSACSPGGNPSPTTQPTGPLPTSTPTSRPTPPPTTINFTLISVRVETYGTKADWKQVKPPLKQIKIGKKVQLSIYFLVNSAPAGEPYTVHWTVTQGGRTLVNQNFTKNSLDASDPTGTYRDRVGPLTIKNAGGVHVLGRLTIGNRAKQSSTSLLVVKKTAPAPPPPPPATFSFDKLVAMDTSGHARSTFGVGQGVVVVVTYTVRNMRPGAVLTGTVNGSYLIPVKGKFQTGGVFQDQIVATKSGAALHRHTTVFSIATSIHVLVRITLGRGFHEKQIPIQVK